MVIAAPSDWARPSIPCVTGGSRDHHRARWAGLQAARQLGFYPCSCATLPPALGISQRRCVVPGPSAYQIVRRNVSAEPRAAGTTETSARHSSRPGSLPLRRTRREVELLRATEGRVAISEPADPRAAYTASALQAPAPAWVSLVIPQRRPVRWASGRYLKTAGAPGRHPIHD